MLLASLSYDNFLSQNSYMHTDQAGEILQEC